MKAIDELLEIAAAHDVASGPVQVSAAFRREDPTKPRTANGAVSGYSLASAMRDVIDQLKLIRQQTMASPVLTNTSEFERDIDMAVNGLEIIAQKGVGVTLG